MEFLIMEKFQIVILYLHGILRCRKIYQRISHKELYVFTIKKLRKFSISAFCCLCCLCIVFISVPYSKSQEGKYTHGFKLYQYDLAVGDSVADNPIPNAELGSFVAEKSEFTYKEVVNYIGVPIHTARLYRAAGFLRVKEAGSYTIIMTSEGGSKYGCIFVNQKLVTYGRNSPFVFTAPVAFDKPGDYEVDMRIYDYINRDLVVPKGHSYPGGSKFSFMIKIPEQGKPQPAHKVLFLPMK